MAVSPRRYTQDEIDELIALPKIVTDPPRRDMRLDRGHQRNDLRLTDGDGKLHFRAFLRRNEDFPENFSIGPIFLPGDGSGELPLLPCNGPHGATNESLDPDHPHVDYHVHRAGAALLRAGLRPEKHSSPCPDFASLEEAVQYFLRTTNIPGAEAFFQAFAQGSLPFDQDQAP